MEPVGVGGPVAGCARLVPAGRRRVPEVVGDLPEEVLVGAPDEPVDDLVQGQLPTQLGEHLAVHLDRQRLAVHQDPIAVEHDMGRGFGPHSVRRWAPEVTADPASESAAVMWGILPHPSQWRGPRR